MTHSLRSVCAVIFGLLLLVLAGVEIYGQQKQQARPAQIDEVIRMTKAGIADDIIISKIDKKSELTVDQLIELKNAGVSDNVIRAMNIDKVSTPSADASQLTNSASVGFHLLMGHEPMILPTSVFTTQKASYLKMAATMGVGKTKQKAVVSGASAKVRTSNRAPQFSFNAGTDAVAPTEYVLIRLDRKSDHREITVGRMNMMGASAGFDKDRVISFSSTRSDDRKWTITVNGPLKPGEYAFYPAAGLQTVGTAVATTGKLHEFGID